MLVALLLHFSGTMKTKLTPAVINRSKPKAQAYDTWDAAVPGLLLRVYPSGVKSFIVQWERGRRVTIGRVGVHTIEQMRVKARAILVDADEHGEPKIAAKRSATLGVFFREHYATHVRANH